MAPAKQDNEAGQSVPSLQLAEATGKKFLSGLCVEDLKAARALDADVIQKTGGRMGMFWPVADGDVLPGDQYELFEAGKFNDTPILAGTNSDEGAMFVRPGATPAAFEKRIRDGFGPNADALLKAYPHATDAEAFQSTKDIFRESAFAWHTWAWANLQSRNGKNKAYVYYFDHHRPESSGASHAAEIAYVFHNLDGRGGAPSAEDVALSDLISSYWVNFASTGDPNGTGLPAWPAFDEKNSSAFYFDQAQTSSARPLPNREKLKAFDEYYARRRAEAKAKSSASK